MTPTAFGSVVFGDAVTEGGTVTDMLDLASAAATLADTGVVSTAMTSAGGAIGIMDPNTGTAVNFGILLASHFGGPRIGARP